MDHQYSKTTKGTWTQPTLLYPTPTDAELQRLEQVLLRESGYSLTGITIKADTDGWLIVLRANLDGQHMVHFTGGRSWQDALEVLVWEVAHKALNWKTDKYAQG